MEDAMARRGSTGLLVAIVVLVMVLWLLERL
jgi:hypothetical protein